MGWGEVLFIYGGDKRRKSGERGDTLFSQSKEAEYHQEKEGIAYHYTDNNNSCLKERKKRYIHTEGYLVRRTSLMPGRSLQTG